MRVLLVHGRAQGGRDATELEAEWRGALEKGLLQAGLSLPADTAFDFPFYGDTLDDEVIRLSQPHRADGAMGVAGDGEYAAFLGSVAREIAEKEGLSDEDIRAEMPMQDGTMGPENWAWVQAIVRLIDRRWTPVASLAIEVILRDVFLYLHSRSMRRAINALVEARLTGEPTVVVAHSLGTVVCYDILKKRTDLDLRGFVTLGSPLGIRAVSGRLGMPVHVAGERVWYNGYDERDIVALNPLDDTYFPTSPSIENDAGLDNDTGNRHGVTGYLDDRAVVTRIAKMPR